ncbi:diguanylate cyclase (GGDEF) domain-containing protein [Bryocella elongata]|uniref:diguanylate cyclase n=1 Tax=Bryocella elongata TaxID=863522 RepID=A0A1H5Z2E7_9BACT|nr:GGDEF domain-containing protein [Bryocella elongata]SEG30673.1 diguanylate cyclase (GGDEF) domain-containing protein [Bryocella elongata]
MQKRSPSEFSNRPDPAQLKTLAILQIVCEVLVLMVAAVVLVGWLVPPIGRLLPSGWDLMKANTALAAGCSAWSLALSQPRRSRSSLLVSRVLAVVVAVLAATSLAEYAFHLSVGLDTLLAADAQSQHPGRMSPQTAGAFALLSVVMICIRARKRPSSRVADFLLFSLCLLILTILSGYAFGAVHMFGITMSTRTSLQTLGSLMLLSFIAFARRAEYGSFSILLGNGIGGRIARIATPFALALPFALQAGSFLLSHSGTMTVQYATATMTSLAAMLAFGLVILLARRIDAQEREIRDLSLRDGLTGLYNRRGFFVLAEQALLLSQRSGSQFSVLFIDLDNLKLVNDTFGHDTGSIFLTDVADLLHQTFRKTDIIGRIGGDEFVVAGEAGEAEMEFASQRLQQAAAQRSAELGRPFPIGFSLGQVTSDANGSETLEDLLRDADHTMYRAKRLKKTQSAAEGRAVFA